MKDLVLKNVGSNKTQVIDVLCNVIGLSAEEAQNIVDRVETGEECKVLSWGKQDDIETIIGEFTAAGATMYEADSNSGDEEYSTFYAGYLAANGELKAGKKKYKPPVPVKEIVNLDRQGTLDVLIEVKRIAQELENIENVIRGYQEKIEQFTAEAKEIETAISDKATAAIIGITVLGFIFGMVQTNLIGGILLGALAYFVGGFVIKFIDSIKNGDENKAKADAYIKENVDPLKDSLAQCCKERDAYENGREVSWAVNVVGEDLFDSDCVQQLYELVKSRRADNLKEALNKLDDIQYKENMNEMQRAIQNASEIAAAESVKQTAYSKSIAQSSRQQAAAARSTAYNARKVARNTRRFR